MSKGIKTLMTCLIVLGLTASVAGCGTKQTAQAPVMTVRTMQVIKQDTTVAYEFVGEIEATSEAQVRAKVSGMVVAKHIKGGDSVKAGQALFTLDNRQYESAALSAQAQLANARASQIRAERDYQRYGQLLNQGAVSQQRFDNQQAEYQQITAQVNANMAMVNKAEVDLAETVVRSPIDGKLDVKDINIGTYVTAGNTVLVTVSAADPVRVKFSMSENEYLKLARESGGVFGKSGVNLRLSDGSKYPLQGKIDQVDRGLAQNTGTMAMKAIFPNPNGLLIPGMFARIETPGEHVEGALLVPQKAVQEQMDKKFVSVVDAEGKAKMVPVKVGSRVGNLWIVESGLQAGDTVIVEGFQKVRPGAPVKAEPITLEELYPVKK